MKAVYDFLNHSCCLEGVMCGHKKSQQESPGFVQQWAGYYRSTFEILLSDNSATTFRYFTIISRRRIVHCLRDSERRERP